MSMRIADHRFVRWARGVTVALVALHVASATLNESRGAGRLVSRDQARHLGLERAWFAQVRLDPARNRVERAILANDRLGVLTTASVLQEINALTGETLWVAPVGNPNYPSLGPSASEARIAVLNGTTLYVLDRTDGRPVMIRRVNGAPGGAPALAPQKVFVPLLDGRVEGYPLDQEIFTPWYFQSTGRVMVPPLVTAANVVWVTDSGHVYMGGTAEFGVHSRLETGSDILAAPAYRKPYIFIGTLSGELFAIDEASGAKRWKYATGYPIARAPAAVGNRVFVTSDEPALHCVDIASGNAHWIAPNVTQFATASRTRVYGVDELGSLVVLDAETGRVVQRSRPSDGTINALVNDQTDRLYLVSDDGMVQCFHEIGAKKPLYHNPSEPKPEDSEQTLAGETEGTPPGTEATQPPAGAEAMSPDEGDAFPDDPVPMDEPAEAEEQLPDDDIFGVEGDVFGEEP
jgi:outer membrane protein assembly factor BamB